MSSSTSKKRGRLSALSAMMYLSRLLQFLSARRANSTYGPSKNPTAPPRFPPKYARLVAVARLWGGNQRAESNDGDHMTMGPTAAFMIWPAWRRSWPEGERR